MNKLAFFVLCFNNNVSYTYYVKHFLKPRNKQFAVSCNDMAWILCYGRLSRMHPAGFCQKFHHGGFSLNGGSLGNRKIHCLAVSISIPAAYDT